MCNEPCPKFIYQYYDLAYNNSFAYIYLSKFPQVMKQTSNTFFFVFIASVTYFEDFLAMAINDDCNSFDVKKSLNSFVVMKLLPMHAATFNKGSNTCQNMS